MGNFSIHVLFGSKDIPNPTIVQIAVTNFSSDAKGRILITPQLASDSEVDYYVNSLVKQLEIIRNDAKKKLRKR